MFTCSLLKLCVFEKKRDILVCMGQSPAELHISHPISAKFFSSEVDSIEDSFTGVFIVSFKMKLTKYNNLKVLADFMKLI